MCLFLISIKIPEQNFATVGRAMTVTIVEDLEMT
jgi:hypothetical protein